MVAPGEPITRICRACGQTFTFDQAELELFGRLAAEQPDVPWHLPKNCTSCRAERRRALETVNADGGELTLRCVECGVDFRFGSRDREYYAARGYRYPRRCPLCRTRPR